MQSTAARAVNRRGCGARVRLAAPLPTVRRAAAGPDAARTVSTGGGRGVAPARVLESRAAERMPERLLAPRVSRVFRPPRAPGPCRMLSLPSAADHGESHRSAARAAL